MDTGHGDKGTAPRFGEEMESIFPRPRSGPEGGENTSPQGAAQDQAATPGALHSLTIPPGRTPGARATLCRHSVCNVT